MNKRKQKKLGRPPEAPSLRTRDLMYLADQLDCNPFEILIHFAKGDYEALGYEEKKKIITKDSMIEELAKNNKQYVFKLQLPNKIEKQ